MLGVWVASTVVLSLAVAWSYAAVLFDAFGAFPLATARAGYLTSPYWLGLTRPTTTALTVLQVAAAAGYVAWQTSLVVHPPARGLLADARWLVLLTTVFLASSAAWPYAAYWTVQKPDSLRCALASAATLWGAAAGVVGLVGGTFEDRRSSPVALLGILALAQVLQRAGARRVSQAVELEVEDGDE